MKQPTVTRLRFADEQLRDLPCPRRPLRLTRGLGSGLAHGPDGRLYALGDRGPNLSIKLCNREYGLDLPPQANSKAKVMPALDIGPALAEIEIVGDEVRVKQLIRLADTSGNPLPGVPTPGSANSRREPALDMTGAPIPPDPGGVDSEGIAVAPDGGFWIGDEYGPSLLRIGPDGRVQMRWVPGGEERTIEGAPFPAEARLPAIAALRHVNRGFEALALSEDGRQLTFAFQSPLAHPDEDAFATACHVRLMTIDTADGALLAHYAYRLEPPKAFARDLAEGPVSPTERKVSELTRVDDRRLLVLERVSHSTKIFLVTLDPARALEPALAEVTTRPTLEEISAAADDLPELDKQLVFDSDRHPEVAKDLEGMTLLDARTLLLVNDNDFGIEDAETSFWRVEWEEAL